MKKKINKIIVLLVVFQITSCVSKKQILYLNEGKINTADVNNNYQLIFKPDDMLQIIVTAEDLEAVQSFNLPVFAVQTSNSVIGQPQLQAYLVDAQGNIEFPVLGKLKVSGLTRVELINLLKKKLDPTYVKNPIINVFITNFKVTVQGDVQRPGTFTLQNERLSIFDALGLAGDLNITANRENVLVVREEDSQKNEYRINLKSKQTLTSPVYYLQQNDIIYVEPNFAKSQDAVFNRSAGLFISIASVFISLITLLTR